MTSGLRCLFTGHVWYPRYSQTWGRFLVCGACGRTETPGPRTGDE